LDAGVRADLFGPFAVRRGDAVLLCTDGLHDALDDLTIGRLAATGPADAIVRALIAAANAAGGRDNVAVTLARWAD
jgi:protein phosphatase